MLEQLKKKQEQFYNQAIVPISKNHISHAYFIETNGNEEELVKAYIREFAKQLFIHGRKDTSSLSEEQLINVIEHHNFPDFLEIEPIKNIIRKEQMLEVQEKFQEKSIYDTYQIYVVYQAETMNMEASNTILKFLEEPEENIIGIFVSKNRYRVINTILSRCSIYALKKEETIINQEDITDSFLSFFENIIERQKDPLMLHYKKYQTELFQEKESIIENINKTIFFLKELWNENTTIEPFQNYKNKISKEALLNIIDIFETMLVKLQYNVNLNLFLDELFLKLTEVKE